MGKIPVAEMYPYLEKMLKEKWGYIWGKSGQIWTQAEQDAATDATIKQYGQKWVGKHVVDCSGVIVYIWKKYGLKIEHSSNYMARYSVGEIGNVPKPGYAAFHWKTTGTPERWQKDGKGNYSHIGIVGSDGKTVYESKGTRYGFTTSSVSKWSYFAPFKDVDYSDKKEEEIPMNEKRYVTADKVNIRKGPGKNYARLRYAKNGEVGDVVAQEGDWVKMAFDDGVTGYVYVDYTKPVGDEEIEEIVDITISLPKAEAEELFEVLKKALGK